MNLKRFTLLFSFAVILALVLVFYEESLPTHELSFHFLSAGFLFIRDLSFLILLIRDLSFLIPSKEFLTFHGHIFHFQDIICEVQPSIYSFEPPPQYVSFQPAVLQKLSFLQVFWPH